MDASAPFDVLEEKDLGDGHTLKFILKSGVSANESLQYITSRTQVLSFREVIPTMNEIFIEKVNQLS